MAGDRLFVDEHFVPPPPAPTVRVSDYPFILPLLERGRRPPPYLYVAVDRRGATIVVHQDDTVRTESIEGDGYPIHKPATAGWKGYGDLVGTTEEAVRTNMRTVADRVTVLADQVRPDVVFISGETRARTDLASVFPDRIQRSVALLHAGSHGVRAAEWEVADDIDRKLNLLWRDNIAARVETFSREIDSGSGRAVQGLADVCAALTERSVETLLVGGMGNATVVTGDDRCLVAVDADALSCLGEPVSRIARADEALPFAAIDSGGAVIIVGSSLVDGIGALLRYPLPTDGKN